MKKIVFVLTVVFTISTLNLMAQKDGYKVQKKSEITQPFKKQDADHFWGIGSSIADLDGTAISAARIMAEGQISESIEVKIKTGVQSYLKAKGAKLKSQKDLDNLVLAISNNIISGITSAGLQLYYNKKEAMYKCELQLKLNKEEALKKAVEEAAAEEQLRLDFDKETFKKSLEKEWDKLEDN
ncbi:MAG: hypothetical protein KAT68_07100 [Bacteroidales bacterium]|nr:hypothetical protein [Bacteroidales bacterium]